MSGNVKLQENGLYHLWFLDFVKREVMEYY